MPKTYHINEEQRAEIEALKEETRNVYVYKRLEVLSLRSSGKKNYEIAAITGYSADRVNHLVSEYCRKGIESFKEDHRKGGNHRNMKPEEEKAFLKPYEEAGKTGQQLTVSEIIKAYQEQRPNSHQSTVYKLLKRHGWRKVSPRPRHPKAASEEAQEASKKLKIGATKLVIKYHS